ncbi:MAG: hypothetical protein ACRDM0_26590 [Thermoleophilaceae bacterium]
MALAGCSAGADDPGAPTSDRRQPAGERQERKAPLQEPQCPAELRNCPSASGRILYVERVDPDGDGTPTSWWRAARPSPRRGYR